MEPLQLLIDERLATVGSTIPVAGHIDQASYSLGDHNFELPHGIDYDLVLTNAGEGILVTGLIKAHVVGVCDRCLDPAEFDIAGEVDGYYLFEDPATDEDDETDDDLEYYLVAPDHTIDVAEALNSALLFETPYIVLCKPDCKGLCPVCGANLNHEDCGHTHAAADTDDISADSPFAALKDFKVDD